MGANTVSYVPQAIYNAFANLTLTTAVNGTTNLLAALAGAGYTKKADTVGNKIGCNCGASIDSVPVERFEIAFKDWAIITNDILTYISAGAGANYAYSQLVSPFFFPLTNLRVSSAAFTDNATFQSFYGAAQRNPVGANFLFAPIVPPAVINGVPGIYKANVVDGTGNVISLSDFPVFMTGNTGECRVYSVTPAPGGGDFTSTGTLTGTIGSTGKMDFTGSLTITPGTDYFVSFKIKFDYLDSFAGSIIQGKMGIVDGFTTASYANAFAGNTSIFSVVGV